MDYLGVYLDQRTALSHHGTEGMQWGGWNDKTHARYLGRGGKKQWKRDIRDERFRQKAEQSIKEKGRTATTRDLGDQESTVKVNTATILAAPVALALGTAVGGAAGLSLLAGPPAIAAGALIARKYYKTRMADINDQTRVVMDDSHSSKEYRELADKHGVELNNIPRT